MHKLLARDYLGKPMIGGHGAGIRDRHAVIIAEDPTFEYQGKYYGYHDVSSIKNWYEEGFSLEDYDYIFIRDCIIDFVEQKVISTVKGTVAQLPSRSEAINGDRFLIQGATSPELSSYNGAIAVFKQGNSPESDQWSFVRPSVLGYRDLEEEIERRYLMQLHIGSPADRDYDFGQSEPLRWRDDYHQKHSVARAKRMKLAEVLIESELKPYQTIIMLNLTSLVTEIDFGNGPRSYAIDFHKNYLNFGTLGSVEQYHPLDNPQPAMGILDYVFGRQMFSGTGLIDMPWQPETIVSLSELCDRLRGILVEGKKYF